MFFGSAVLEALDEMDELARVLFHRHLDAGAIVIVAADDARGEERVSGLGVAADRAAPVDVVEIVDLEIISALVLLSKAGPL